MHGSYHSIGIILSGVDQKIRYVKIIHFLHHHIGFISKINMMCNWVGYSKIKHIDVDELFNIKEIINELKLFLNVINIW